MDEWANWSNEMLTDYEQRLFDDEMRGDDTWELREAALDEMRRRGLMD